MSETRMTSSGPRRLVTIVAVVAVLAGGLMLLRSGRGPVGGSLLAQAVQEADGPPAKGQGKKAGKKDPPENPFPNRPQAPSLDGGAGWLNTAGEINLKDLRGKVVLLDFWTYCCINCMHVLPDLKYLEKKYPNELVVIGVHSAKFDNEKDSEAIRGAILRYEIEHPVINDANMTVWRKFQVSSWPTQVLIDPEGRYVGQQPGEGNRELFDKAIELLIDYHKQKGTLDTTPVRFDLERNHLKTTPLKFPGKVLIDVAGKRLFITDSNHNRIVVTTLGGKLLEVIGNGAIGRSNGTYKKASFDHPQGTVLIGHELYVADTENHMIRVINLKTKLVRTLAGTGQQARRRDPLQKKPLRTTPLNSPWALAHIDGVLYIAMAGPHQLWSHALGSKTIDIFAGTGREDISDGSLARCALAQPSAIATDGKYLFIADSEGSAIRQVDTDPMGRVTTVVGTHDLFRGRSLFEFGDVDGIGEKARLQHPLGVAYHDGILYVADTYNHKIKRIRLKSRKASSWLGDGKKGKSINPPRFNEPAGVAVGAGKLYVADTNNHRICVVDLKDGKVETLKIPGLKAPVAPKPRDNGILAKGTPIVVPPQAIQSKGTLRVTMPLAIPPGFKLNPRASILFRAKASSDQQILAADGLNSLRKAAQSGESAATATLALTGKTGKVTVELSVSYQVCRGGKGGLCKLLNARWSIPLSAAADSTVAAITLPAAAK